MANPLDQIESFYKSRVRPIESKWYGIFYILLICFLFFLLVNQGVSCVYPNHIDLFPFIYPPLVLFGAVYWLLIRKMPKFKKHTVGILFAFRNSDFHIDKEVVILYEKLIKSFKMKGQSYKDISIKILPSRFSIEDEITAHEIRQLTGAKIIIWGDMSQGNINGAGSVVGFNPICFSYGMPLPKDKTDLFSYNLTRRLSSKRWVIKENNSFVDRDYLTRNISEFTEYLLAWILTFSTSNFEQGFAILNSVYKGLMQKREELNIDEKISFQNTRILLLHAYEKSVSNLNLSFIDCGNEEKIIKSELLLRQIREVGIINQFLLFEAILYFLKSEVPQSFVSLKNHIKLFPKNGPGYYSIAFLYFYTRDLKNAFYFFDCAIKKKIGQEQVKLILIWYEDLLKLTDEKHLNYPMGVIYFDVLKDNQNAIIYLEKFLFESKPKNGEEEVHDKMIKMSRKKLNKLNWNKYLIA